MIFLFSTYSKIYHLQRSFTNIFTLEPVRRVSSVTEITHIFKQVKLSPHHTSQDRYVQLSQGSCHQESCPPSSDPCKLSGSRRAPAGRSGRSFSGQGTRKWKWKLRSGTFPALSRNQAVNMESSMAWYDSVRVGLCQGCMFQNNTDTTNARRIM